MTAAASVRRATHRDFDQASILYAELVGASKVAGGEDGRTLWQNLLNLPGTDVFCLERDGQLCAITTLHVMPNLTHHGRPYALIENVVTLKAEQGKGYGKLVMQAAIERAWELDCYKIMLLTGKKAEAKGFYERLGFSADEKHGMTIRRVPTRN